MIFRIRQNPMQIRNISLRQSLRPALRQDTSLYTREAFGAVHYCKINYNLYIIL